MMGAIPKVAEVSSILAEYGSFAGRSEIDEGRSITVSVYVQCWAYSRHSLCVLQTKVLRLAGYARMLLAPETHQLQTFLQQ